MGFPPDRRLRHRPNCDRDGSRVQRPTSTDDASTPDYVETSEDLKLALTNHLGKTQEQVDRPDGVFMAIGKSPEAKKCKGMAGLLDEGKDIMKEDMEPALKDVALISAAQRVKHYEIAA